MPLQVILLDIINERLADYERTPSEIHLGFAIGPNPLKGCRTKLTQDIGNTSWSRYCRDRVGGSNFVCGRQYSCSAEAMSDKQRRSHASSRHCFSGSHEISNACRESCVCDITATFAESGEIEPKDTNPGIRKPPGQAYGGETVLAASEAMRKYRPTQGRSLGVLNNS